MVLVVDVEMLLVVLLVDVGLADVVVEEEFVVSR